MEFEMHTGVTGQKQLGVQVDICGEAKLGEKEGEKERERLYI